MGKWNSRKLFVLIGTFVGLILESWLDVPSDQAQGIVAGLIDVAEQLAIILPSLVYLWRQGRIDEVAEQAKNGG